MTEGAPFSLRVDVTNWETGEAVKLELRGLTIDQWLAIHSGATVTLHAENVKYTAPSQKR